MSAARLLGEVISLPRAAAAAALGALVAVSEGIVVLLLLPLLALVGLDLGGGTAGALLDRIGAALAAIGIPLTLGAVLLVYVVLAAAQAGLVRAQNLATIAVREAAGLRLRRALYESLARMRWPAFVARHSSAYVHLLTAQVDRVRAGVGDLLDLVSHVLVTVVYLALAFRLSPQVAAATLLSGGVLLLLTRRFTRTAQRGGEHLTDVTRSLQTTVMEHLANMKVAKSFRAEDRHVAHFESAARDVATGWQTAGSAFASARTAYNVGSAVVLAVAVYAGVAFFGVESAAILILLYVFARLVPRLGAAQRSLQYLHHSLPALSDAARELQRARDACEETGVDRQGFDTISEVQFRTVSYTHDGGAPAVADIDITVMKGGITAIVGPSGAGKTTLADLLLGLILPMAGEICVDGVRLDPHLLGAWRAAVGYVPQDTVLFSDTLRNNLLWAVPGADDEDVERCIRLAGAEFVYSLPFGLETMAGERGNRLSGGERQRIAIARALLSRPRLLVLDEATSSLDLETERRILADLRLLSRSMAIVIISHRLPMLRVADRIYVLEGGRVIEHGSWDTLASGPTRFRLLMESADAPSEARHPS